MTAIVLYHNDRHVNGHADSFVCSTVSLVPSFHSQLFFTCCKKSEREPGQIRHVKCIIPAGRVRGFVECSDLAVPRG